jgi:hypothetical protein
LGKLTCDKTKIDELTHDLWCSTAASAARTRQGAARLHLRLVHGKSYGKWWWKR